MEQQDGVGVDVERRILDFLRSKGEIPGRTDEERRDYAYLEQGHIDSMEIVELVTYLEGTFGIRFEPNHLQSLEFGTVGGLIDLVGRLSAVSARESSGAQGLRPGRTP